jgi:putative endonuclease
MVNQNQSYGKNAEEFAAQFLRQKGYEIVEKNFKNRIGEIDLIARNNGYLVFIEVKARQTDDFGGPASAMTPSKQRKLMQMAKAYMVYKNIETDARFDVVLIHGSMNAPSVELIQNAFEMR